MECQHCHTIIKEEYSLCDKCELRFALLLLGLSNDLQPLHDSLDSTLHPGGHQPTRIILSTPPTPIRLDVLDLLDIIESTASELLRRLQGVDAHLDSPVSQPESLRYTLLDCASHPRLAMLQDIGLYYDIIQHLSQQVDTILDPPEERQPIGTCELCAHLLTAGTRDQWVVCPICEREQRVSTVKLRRLKMLCFDDTKTGTAAEIAKAFTNSGIMLRRNTVTQWAKRGRLPHVAKRDKTPLYLYSSVYRLTIAPST